MSIMTRESRKFFLVTEEYLLSIGYKIVGKLHNHKIYSNESINIDDILFDILKREFNWNCWEDVVFPKYIHKFEEIINKQKK